MTIKNKVPKTVSAKLIKKILGHLISPFALGLVVTFAMTYLALKYYSSQHDTASKEHSLTALVQQLHEKTIDWRMTDRGPRPGSDRVAILAIDEKAIEQEGRWPWPRDKVARLIDKAVGYGAKSVSFDIVFSEEDSNSSQPTLRRLKHDLKTKQELTPSIDTLIASELSKSDGDRVLADTVKARADHTIMGSFFEDYDTIAPYKDYCIDALFARTFESRYWAKEAIPVSVIDAPLTSQAFPTQIRESLTDYFTLLEVSSSGHWFETHKELNTKISEAMEDFGPLFPVETYPGIATLWLNNDIDSMKPLVEQVKPELATPEGVRALLSRFGSAFQRKEASSLEEEVRTAGRKYCDRFFGENDELLTEDKYKSLWGDSPESKEAFATYSWQSLWPKLQAANSANAVAHETLPDAIARFRSQAIPNAVSEVARWVVSIPIIADNTKHTGYFNAVPDSDGSIRRSVLLVRRGNSYMPSLALKTLLVDQGLNIVANVDTEKFGKRESATKGIQSLVLKDSQGNTVLKIPVDTVGNMMINYAGGSEMFAYVSAADILSDEPDMLIQQQQRMPNGHWEIAQKKVPKKEFLNNKLLIAGATATGIYDLRVTPFEENYPGVETHANVLSNLLVELDKAKGATPVIASSIAPPGFLRTDPKEEHLMWVVLLVGGILLSGLLAYFGSVAGLGITIVALAVVYAVDKFVLFKHGIVIVVLFPILSISANFVALTFYKYFTEERKKRELKGTFEKYVSPSIVAEVLADPSNIELGGKKVEMTVMFSDVRGFTTISEKLDPRELSNLLNSYLTPMTELVFKNKGTLDKYMGDAIMSFWGAPIHFPDHAHHGCRCALQMLVKLKQLQAEYRAKGLPEIDIGIGLNTGDMSVGNMGSETVRSYTVMGDAVNLGSRLEGINKQYGTRIIISEFTQSAVKEKFVTREVDWVRVKGKAQPVRIFELIAEGSVPDETKQLLKHFGEGFTLYHERKFTEAIAAFERALEVKSDDAVTQLYVERSRDYLEELPPENWDGVFTMKSK
jgi:class 3 adenylate cyclase/CHASE2 domain-containing sensor protein